MRRPRPPRLAAVLALATAAAAIAAAPGEPAGPKPAVARAGAAAAGCVPVAHSKTVVKRARVKRRGRVVKVKRRRKRRWTTCEPAPAPPSGCAEPAAAVGVIARDQGGSSFTLTRDCVSAGTVTVQLNNQGEDPHNVFIRPLSGPDPVYTVPADAPYELGPLSQDSGDFPLTAGDWYLWCDIGLHRALGMEAVLKVG